MAAPRTLAFMVLPPSEACARFEPAALREIVAERAAGIFDERVVIAHPPYDRCIPTIADYFDEHVCPVEVRMSLEFPQHRYRFRSELGTRLHDSRKVATV